MIVVINIILNIHMIIGAIYLMLTVYMQSTYLQNKVSFKYASYSFYTLLFVGIIFSIFGTKTFDFLEFVPTKSFINLYEEARSSGGHILVHRKVNTTPVTYVYFLYIAIATSIFGVLYSLFGCVQLFMATQKMIYYKNYKNIKIFLNPILKIPYVFSFFGKSYIVMPRDFLKNKNHFKNILIHELQHIRNLDTGFIFFLNFLKNTFFINPAAHGIYTQMRNLHELAVDKEIVEKHKCKRIDYLKTMAWVFENINKNERLYLANGFFGSNRIKEYKVRIKSIKNETQSRTSILFLVFLVVFGTIGVSCVSSVSKDKLNIVDITPTHQNKNIYQMKFVVFTDGKITTNATLATKEGEAATIEVVDDPDSLIVGNQLEKPIEKYKNWQKFEFVATSIDDDWVNVSIKGNVIKNRKKKNIEIITKYKLGVVNKLESINSEFLIEHYKEKI